MLPCSGEFGLAASLNLTCSLTLRADLKDQIHIASLCRVFCVLTIGWYRRRIPAVLRANFSFTQSNYEPSLGSISESGMFSLEQFSALRCEITVSPRGEIIGDTRCGAGQGSDMFPSQCVPACSHQRIRVDLGSCSE